MSMSGTTDKIGVVILAAGQGTRMKSELPKVMHKLAGRPMIDYVVAAVESAGHHTKNFSVVAGIKPVVVVSPTNHLAREFLGARVDYAIQEKQLGTGHAVACAEKILNGFVDHVMVFYGDHPYLKSESIKRLMKRHVERGNTVTLMTAVVPDFEGWRAPFYDFGRVIRGANGHVAEIVERKDANEEELKTKEINPSYFCFKADWLWKNLKELKNNNAQKEYYLTDLVKQAIDAGEKISSIEIEPAEALGVNSQDDLKLAHDIK